MAELSNSKNTKISQWSVFRRREINYQFSFLRNNTQGPLKRTSISISQNQLKIISYRLFAWILEYRAISNVRRQICACENSSFLTPFFIVLILLRYTSSIKRWWWWMKEQLHPQQESTFLSQKKRKKERKSEEEKKWEKI